LQHNICFWRDFRDYGRRSNIIPHLQRSVVILVAYWSNNLHKQPNLSNIQCPRKIRRSRFKPENINGKKEKHRGDDVMIPTTNPATSGRESERTARICGESEEKKGERARVVMSRWNPWFSWSWAYLPNSIPPASRHPLFPSRISDSVPTWERTRTRNVSSCIDFQVSCIGLYASLQITVQLLPCFFHRSTN
jgi:hypothetical protein